MSLQTLIQNNRNGKVVSIGAAVAAAVLYLIYDTVTKPPKNLRHIPYHRYFPFMKAMLKKTPFNDVLRTMTRPLIEREATNGIYVRPDRTGWMIIVSNVEAVKTVLFKTDKFPKADLDAGKEGTVGYRFFGGPNIVTLNGHDWKKHRMIANPAFHRAMPIKLFGHLTKKMFKTIEDLDMNELDVVDLMERWTLDAIGNAGFDFDFDALGDPNSQWVNTYNTVMKGLRDPTFFFFPFLEQKFLWFFPKRRHVHNELTKLLEMLRGVIESKRAKLKSERDSAVDDSEKDLLAMMLESEIDGESAMSDRELMSNLAIFFLAGHDTTANALSFAIYYLAVNQDIQETARQEAIRILGDEPRDIVPTVEQTKGLEYINAVMKETLRMNGPAPSVLPRVVAEDCELANTFIPKGSKLAVSIYDLHHDPNVWSDPEKFNPDRFLPGGESEQKAGSGLSWLPFSNGSRQCIGMNFSLTEQRIMLPMLLRKYKWTLSDNSPHKEKVITNSIGVMTSVNLKIKVEKRY